jgi:uncharacterized protein (DUF1684 family)
MLRKTAARSPLLLPLLALCAWTGAAPAPEPHRAEIEAWRAKRLASLKREDGWLTLVGLFWLQEGENRLGSDSASNRIVFPKDTTPKTLGSLDLSKGVVTLRAARDAGLTSDGHPVTTLTLRSDTEGSPTIVKHGRISFFLIKRGERLGVRVKDSRSPALLAFRGIDTYPIDARWRFDARFEPYPPGKTIAVPNILGSTEQEKSPGAVVFETSGRESRLDAVTEEGSDKLFLIFGDQTNGVDTYGGGRFLYAAQPGKDGRVVLDFNKAYNPPCVFTPYATCPLPPAQNRLPIRVEAGEKRYGGH